MTQLPTAAPTEVIRGLQVADPVPPSGSEIRFFWVVLERLLSNLPDVGPVKDEAGAVAVSPDGDRPGRVWDDITRPDTVARHRSALRRPAGRVKLLWRNRIPPKAAGSDGLSASETTRHIGFAPAPGEIASAPEPVAEPAGLEAVTSLAGWPGRRNTVVARDRFPASGAVSMRWPSSVRWSEQFSARTSFGSAAVGREKTSDTIGASPPHRGLDQAEAPPAGPGEARPLLPPPARVEGAIEGSSPSARAPMLGGEEVTRLAPAPATSLAGTGIQRSEQVSGRGLPQAGVVGAEAAPENAVPVVEHELTTAEPLITDSSFAGPPMRHRRPHIGASAGRTTAEGGPRVAAEGNEGGRSGVTSPTISETDPSARPEVNGQAWPTATDTRISRAGPEHFSPAVARTSLAATTEGRSDSRILDPALPAQSGFESETLGVESRSRSETLSGGETGSSRQTEVGVQGQRQPAATGAQSTVQAESQPESAASEPMGRSAAREEQLVPQQVMRPPERVAQPKPTEGKAPPQPVLAEPQETLRARATVEDRQEMNLLKEVGEADGRRRGSSREETAGSEASRRFLPEALASPRTPDLETWRQIGHTNMARETARELTLHHLNLLHQVHSGVLKASQHSRVTVQLRPPKLGAIEIAVESRSGQLQAHFHATHIAVHAWLRENMPTLRAQLAEAGLNLNDFTLSTSAQHQHDLPPELSSPWQRDRHGQIPAETPIRSLPRVVADASRMVDCFA